ncbi:uncharacterized protein LOC143580553 [Bidens hawaiensis]|uniref:uncharacterized protein LOC143580553 n=1 Tax=Bidens hawaiensis TaxID=980011 RepID=UPI004049CFAF
MLIAGQINGTYEAKNDMMASYLSQAKDLIVQFSSFKVLHIKRSENKSANALSKLASMNFEHFAKDIRIEVLDRPSVPQHQVLVIQTSVESWMTPIMANLTSGILPEEKVAARKIGHKALNYQIQDGVLYRRSFLGPLLRCVDGEDAKYLIMEIHEGICGLHDGPRMVVAKLMIAGYYWPGMHMDAKWAIDIMGPFPEAPGRVKFLIVAIDYFTKWVEAKPIASITAANIKKFLWEFIIYRFGLLQEFISDNGTQFADDGLQAWLKKLHTTQVFTSVAHPQANGQVERANRTIKDGIKARVVTKRIGWVDELPHVLWALRTQKKTINSETPFSLTYGTEAMILAEIGVPSARTLSADNIEEELRMNLNLLEERRELELIREHNYKRQLQNYYDSRVQKCNSDAEDFIFRNNEASGQEPSSKLAPTWEDSYKVKEVLSKGVYKLEKLDGTEIPRTWNVAQSKRCYIRIEEATVQLLEVIVKVLKAAIKLKAEQIVFMHNTRSQGPPLFIASKEPEREFQERLKETTDSESDSPDIQVSVSTLRIDMGDAVPPPRQTVHARASDGIIGARSAIVRPPATNNQNW